MDLGAGSSVYLLLVRIIIYLNRNHNNQMMRIIEFCAVARGHTHGVPRAGAPMIAPTGDRDISTYCSSHGNRGHPS